MMGMTGMETWTFKTAEKDGHTGYSSAMSKDRALEFICDLLIIGIRVVSLESSGGEIFDEEEIARMCHERRNRPKDRTAF